MRLCDVNGASERSPPWHDVVRGHLPPCMEPGQLAVAGRRLRRHRGANRRRPASRRAVERWPSETSISPGDRAYLVRQHRDRGLVGSGEFTSEIYEDDHWDGSGRETTYADLAWDLLLPVEDRISVEVLKAEVRDVRWDRLQGSGVLISDHSERELDRLWEDNVSGSVFRSPEEPTGRFPEGAVRRVEVNRYERDQRARAACIAHHGTACSVCGFDFEKSYGVLGRGFIHVHHLTEISAIGPTYKIDPIKVLRPVCPNCHAMVHRGVPALSISELRKRLRSQPNG